MTTTPSREEILKWIDCLADNGKLLTSIDNKTMDFPNSGKMLSAIRDLISAPQDATKALANLEIARSLTSCDEQGFRLDLVKECLERLSAPVAPQGKMRTAEEWARKRPWGTREELAEFVREVQQDALASQPQGWRPLRELAKENKHGHFWMMWKSGRMDVIENDFDDNLENDAFLLKYGDNLAQGIARPAPPASEGRRDERCS